MLFLLFAEMTRVLYVPLVGFGKFLAIKSIIVAEGLFNSELTARKCLV